MNVNDTNVIEAKFKRCPKCRSYSVKQTELNSREKVKGFLFRIVPFYCDNCSYRYVEYDSFLKTLNNRLIRHKWHLAGLLVLVAILIAILLLPRNKSQPQPHSIPTSEPLVKKREVLSELDHPTEIKKITVGKITEEKREPKPTQERTVEKPEPATPPVILHKRESIRVFPTTVIKVRSSARNTVGPAHRWSFLKNRITVRREAHQHVYVAGNSTGTQKWAVDDQLIINGKVYEGLSASYDKKAGYLPEISKNMPLDITNLVPPDQETLLEIELVDHGKLWANTEIHIVVK